MHAYSVHRVSMCLYEVRRWNKTQILEIKIVLFTEKNSKEIVIDKMQKEEEIYIYLTLVATRQIDRDLD